MNRHDYSIRQRELSPRGSALPFAKMDEAKVREVREIHDKAMRARAFLNEHCSAEGLAKECGISVSAMQKILSRETWVHVK